MSKKRSAVWLYFEMIDRLTAKCSLCQRILKSHGSTGNLIDHLRRRHSSIVSISSVVGEDAHASFQDESQLASSSEPGSDVETNTGAHFLMKHANLNTSSISNDSCVKNSAASPTEKSSSGISHVEESDSTKINHALVDMLASGFRPISMINGEGFQGLMHALRPSYTLPSRREFLTQYLPDRYENARMQVKNLVDQAEYVSIVADIWKLKYRCFVTCYAYCILDSKLHCFLLATEQIPYDYTQKSIVSALSTIAVDWDIDNKIACVVIENNQLMISSIEELELPYLPCINYNVKQLVSEVFEVPVVLEVRQICRTIVNYFKENAAASNKLIELQLLMSHPKLKLLTETPFKWRTTIAMFKRLLKVKNIVSLAISKLNGSPEPLTDAEWDVLSDCVLLLDPLVNMMKEILSDEYQLASQIIPRIHIAHEQIVSCCPVSVIGTNLKSILINSFKEKLSFYNESKVAVHSTLLDPRLKEYGFRDETSVENARLSLINDLTTEYERSLFTKNEQPTDNNIIYFDNNNVSKKSAQDYKQYSSMNLICRESSNPFLFWEEVRNSLPLLAKLGLKYMCIPAHILRAKKMFSKFQFVKMLRVSNLKAKKNINKFIFLHAFCKMIGDNRYDFV